MEKKIDPDIIKKEAESSPGELTVTKEEIELITSIIQNKPSIGIRYVEITSKLPKTKIIHIATKYLNREIYYGDIRKKL